MKLAIAALAAAALAAPAHADTLTEEASGHVFTAPAGPDGRPLMCLGTGLRKKFFIKVYAAVFCVDRAAGTAAVKKYAAAHPGADLAEDSGFFLALRDLAAPKTIRMYFLREVDKGKIKEAYSETLHNAGLPQAKIDAFTALVDRDIREHAEIVLATTPGGLTLTLDGVEKKFDDAEVAHLIWDAWLGPKGVSDSLKESIGRGAGAIK